MRFAISALYAVLALFFPGHISGQTPKRSAPKDFIVPVTGFLREGGVVNSIEGDVSGERAGVAIQAVGPKDQLKKGDVVRVGGSGRAEILLNPGYYLRLFSSTEVTFLDLSPDNLKVKVTSGSAIIEMLVIDLNLVFSRYPPDWFEGIYSLVTLVTPQGNFVLTEGGVYRLDVKADGSSELNVTKGSADVLGNRVKSGMRAAVRDGTAALSKFDKDPGDDFDDWSRKRAALLIRVNRSLEKSDWYKQLNRNWSSHLEIEDGERTEQARQRLTVSASGGLVGFVEDGVVFRRGESGWEKLSEDVALEYGDRVRTDESSRAEILLYPTCQLLLSSATEVAYLENPDRGVAVKVIKGSAIVISTLDAKDQHLVTLVAPDGEYEIARMGVYRLNIRPGGGSEMRVYYGRVKYAGREIKEGNKVIPQEAGRAVQSMSKKPQDSFDLWGKRRVAAFAYPYSLFLSFSRADRPEFSGMWCFDQASGAYTFVPGRIDFKSPYGGRYPTKFRLLRGGRNAPVY